MKKSIYLISFIWIWILSSCQQKENNISHPGEKETEIKKTECSIKFNLGETDSAYYYIRYCTFEKNKIQNETSFIYSADSTFFSKNPITENHSPKEYLLTYRINSSHDTLFNTIQEDNYIQSYQFLLSDSLVVNFDDKTVRLFEYERILDEHTWDEVIYISKEIGFVYGYSKFFKGDKRLIAHSDLSYEELNNLISQLKDKNTDNSTYTPSNNPTLYEYSNSKQ